MCLSVVAKIIEKIEDNEAIAELGNVRKTINLGLLGDEVESGDWVLIHTGFAIQVIDEEKANEILAAYQEIDDLKDLEISRQN